MSNNQHDGIFSREVWTLSRIELVDAQAGLPPLERRRPGPVIRYQVRFECTRCGSKGSIAVKGQLEQSDWVGTDVIDDLTVLHSGSGAVTVDVTDRNMPVVIYNRCGVQPLTSWGRPQWADDIGTDHLSKCVNARQTRKECK